MEKIILLKPYFSHTIWGGTALRDEYGYDEPGDDIGECWGISAFPSKESVVLSGEFEGCKLSELWRDHRELFGNVPGDVFPLLVKIIDARDDLSIQVHPDDKYASEHENGSLGKKECWYVLKSPEDGEMIIGHNARTREELNEMIDGGRWDELIRRVKVDEGDSVHIEPGTVHTLTKGTVVLETQQSSNITYRLYDYDRLMNGVKRELHLQKSKDVITVPDPSPDTRINKARTAGDNSVTGLMSCDRFTVSRIVVKGTLEFGSDAPFINASVIKGSGKVFDTDVKKGSHMIITSEGAEKIVLRGDMELIVSRI